MYHGCSVDCSDLCKSAMFSDIETEETILTIKAKPPRFERLRNAFCLFRLQPSHAFPAFRGGMPQDISCTGWQAYSPSSFDMQVGSFLPCNLHQMPAFFPLLCLPSIPPEEKTFHMRSWLVVQPSANFRRARLPKANGKPSGLRHELLARKRRIYKARPN